MLGLDSIEPKKCKVVLRLDPNMHNVHLTVITLIAARRLDLMV